jgi:hypothetical protein
LLHGKSFNPRKYLLTAGIRFRILKPYGNGYKEEHMPPPTTSSVIERERQTTLDEIIEQARQEEWTIADLAKDLGVTQETARAYLKDHGYEPHNGIRIKR